MTTKVTYNIILYKLYLTFLGISPSPGAACNSGCQQCWSSNISDCYLECTTATNFLTESTCNAGSQSASQSFFRNPIPGQTVTEVALKSLKTVSTGTISFFMKFYGITTSVGNILKYSANLFLQFDSNLSGANYGLSLIRGDTNNTNIIANDPTFKSRTGQWTHIHLSYTDQGIPDSFPTMINFMIGSNNIKIIGDNISGLSIDKFSIPKTTYALFTKLRVYSNYLINSYGFVMNNFASFPIPIETHFDIGTNQFNCFIQDDMENGVPSAVDPVCVRDYDNHFNPANQITTGQFQYFSSTSYKLSNNLPCNSVGGVYTCFTACSNNSGDGQNIDCSCAMNNGNTSMILKNSGMNTCKSN